MEVMYIVVCYSGSFLFLDISTNTIRYRLVACGRNLLLKEGTVIDVVGADG